LVLSPILDPFVQHNPFAVSTRIALDHALPAAFLNDLFEQHAKVQYCRTLTFAAIVETMSAVVFRQARSVREAYQRKLKDAGVSLTALYSKLAGVELQTMQALVRQSAVRLRSVLAALAPVTPWIEGFRVKILDGNGLAGTDHRLAPLRDTNAAALPGMSLVVYEPEWRLVTDIFPSEDAYTQERTLLPLVLETVQPGDLWIGDRSFATQAFFRGLYQRGATFLIREHGHNTVYEVLGTVGKKSKGDTGVISEQRIWLHLGEGQGMVARRITVELFEPTQDGDTHLHLITNVPRPKLTARRAAELYRNRWHIEHAFLDLTRDLRCEVNTLAYPKAALFGFCTALMGFNALAVCKQAVEAEHGREEAEALSSYALVGDISSAMRALEVLVSAEQSEAWEQASAKQVARLLRRVVKGAELWRYRKAERGPKKEKPKRKGSVRQRHVSTARLLPKGSQAP
jgi:IS4 transposase